MRIGRGKAFDLGEPPNADSHIAVRRQFVTLQGRYLLVEGVLLQRIAPHLSTLPLHASINSKLPKMASKTRILPDTPLARSKAQPMKFATASAARQRLCAGLLWKLTPIPATASFKETPPIHLMWLEFMGTVPLKAERC